MKEQQKQAPLHVLLHLPLAVPHHSAHQVSAEPGGELSQLAEFLAGRRTVGLQQRQLSAHSEQKR